MKLEKIETAVGFKRNKSGKAVSVGWYLIINDKKEIKLTEKEFIKIENLMVESGNKLEGMFFSAYFSDDEKFKKKFIDFIAKKTKRRKKCKNGK